MCGVEGEVGVAPEQGGGGDGDTGASGSGEDFEKFVFAAWLNIAAAFISVIVCNADRGPVIKPIISFIKMTHLDFFL